MKPIEKVSVLVHPHYMSFYYEKGIFPPRQLNRLELRKSIKPLAAGDSELEWRLKEMELLHTRYRKHVDRIAKNPGELLAVVRGVHSSDWHELINLPADVSREAGQRAVEHGRNYQDKLIEYARRKLGKRLFIIQTDWANWPKHVPRDLKKELSTRDNPLGLNVPVRVWGESEDVCAKVVREGLLNSGFRQTRKDPERKSVPSGRNRDWEDEAPPRRQN